MKLAINDLQLTQGQRSAAIEALEAVLHGQKICFCINCTGLLHEALSVLKEQQDEAIRTEGEL